MRQREPLLCLSVNRLKGMKAFRFFILYNRCIDTHHTYSRPACRYTIRCSVCCTCGCAAVREKKKSVRVPRNRLYYTGEGRNIVGCRRVCFHKDLVDGWCVHTHTHTGQRMKISAERIFFIFSFPSARPIPKMELMLVCSSNTTTTTLFAQSHIICQYTGL
jgi:hypothetical protein